MRIFRKLRFCIWTIILISFAFAFFAPPRALAAEEIKEVALDFDNVDIRLFIRVMSELTGKNFIIDNNVKGKVTVLSPKKLTIQQAFEVFKSVLAVNGFALVESEEAIKIVPSQNISGYALPVNTNKIIRPEDQFITQIMPLRYLEAQTLLPVIKPLLARQGSVFAIPSGDLLIVTDSKANVRKISEILTEVDIGISDAKVEKLELKYASAADVTTKLGEVLELKYGKGHRGIRPSLFKIIPLERINAILVVAPSDILDEVANIVSKIDQPSPEGKSLLNVYYLENAKAEDIVRVLTGTEQAMKSYAESRSSAASSTGGQMGATQERRTEAGGTVVGGKFKALGKEVSILADKSTNSLIIYAEPDDYNTIKQMIKKLDIPRKQVYIQALIMEVSPTENFSFGTEWMAFQQVGSINNKNVYGLGISSTQGGPIQNLIASGSGAASSSSTTASTPLPPGFSVGVLGDAITVGNFTFPSLAVLISALQTLKTTNILSKPQLMTLNNEEASINISTNRPFQTTETLITGGGSSQNIDYRDVGIKLKITPHINQSGKINLELNLEVSKLTGVETSPNTPVTLKRAIDTVVEVNNHGTIVIGGLIEKQQDFSKTGLPCIANMPLLGWAFKTVGATDTNTNLLVFISPTVYERPQEAAPLSKEKKDYMDQGRTREMKRSEEEKPFFMQDEFKRPFETNQPQPEEEDKK
jgi:general secretion pathway protein D